MLIQSEKMEEQAILQTAARMCAAARTAPKAKGKDNIITLVLTGEEKDKLAEQMDAIGEREFPGEKNIFARDAGNLRAAQAVVLIGVRPRAGGLKFCSICNFKDCQTCAQNGAQCAFTFLDQGIAIGSAAAVAADDRVDNRVMYTVGKAAEEMGYAEEGVRWQGIPLSIAGKSPFFDR